jgi:uncharacterized protein (TIGR00251 family)
MNVGRGFVTEIADGLILSLWVQPKAGRNEIVGVVQDELKVKIKAPPIDGAANAELIKFLAREFGVKKSTLQILGGGNGRHKKVKLVGATFISVTGSSGAGWIPS